MKLVKEFSRDYSLFGVVAFNQAMTWYEEYTGKGVPDFILIYDPAQGDLVKEYFEPKQLEDLFAAMEEKAGHSIEEFQNLVDTQKERFESMFPFFENTKKVKDVDELKKLWNDFHVFWSRNGVTWVIATRNGADDDVLKLAREWRSFMEKHSSDRDRIFDHQLRHLFPELGDLVHFLYPDTVFSATSLDEIKTQAEEASRGYTMYRDQYLPGEKGKKFVQEKGYELVSSMDESQEIQGQVASPGKVTGTARLVYKVSDIDNVKDSDIIVSPMTRPDFLPAMKRAAAFVTDEGGVTSHAAIVSRELKKPCVIGTKIATEKIQEGDTIEVDANRGIVRVLS